MDAEPEAVQVTTTPDGITTITLSRRQRTNAVDTPTAQKLYQAFLTFESAADQKVCVFYGAHGNFCAGFDLTTVQAPSQTPSQSSSPTNASLGPASPVHGRNLGPMGPTRLQVQKPVICAVAGYAVAGGLELSLVGDIRVAEESAVFGVFCRRFGVPLIDGGTVRLQAVVGLGRALDMVLTGRGVGAREALGMGLVNYVVPDGRALEKAVEIARGLVGFPQLCMNVDRRSVYYAAFEAGSFEEAMGFEFRNGVEVVAKEGLKGAERFRRGVGRHGASGSGGKL